MSHFPPPPQRQPDQPIAHHGAALLRYVLEHRITVTLTEDQLELAHYAGAAAMTAQYADVRIYDRINDARHEISGELRRRQALQPAAPLALPPTSTDDRPNAGPMAPLEPAPIVRPPTPDAPATCSSSLTRSGPFART